MSETTGSGEHEWVREQRQRRMKRHLNRKIATYQHGTTSSIGDTGERPNGNRGSGEVD